MRQTTLFELYRQGDDAAWGEIEKDLRLLVGNLVQANYPYSAQDRARTQQIVASVLSKLQTWIRNEESIDTRSLHGRLIGFVRATVVSELIEQSNELFQGIVIHLRKTLDPRIAARASASEILQEAKMKALSNSAGFVWQGEPAFKSWVRWIIKGVLKQAQKRGYANRRDVTRNVSEPASGVIGLLDRDERRPRQQTPSSKANYPELVDRIREIVDTELTSKQRTVFLLRYESQMTFKEIVEAVDDIKNEPMAKMRCQRALQTLRKCVAERYGDSWRF